LAVANVGFIMQNVKQRLKEHLDGGTVRRSYLAAFL